MSKKKSSLKGQKKEQNASDRKDNPLLKIDDKVDFSIESSNLLQDPEQLLFPDYLFFDLNKDKDHFDFDKLNDDSSIIIVLRYYEYVCIVPILQSGLNAKDVFDMIKHALRNRLLLEAPSFDVIFEPDMHYDGKIKY